MNTNLGSISSGPAINADLMRQLQHQHVITLLYSLFLRIQTKILSGGIFFVLGIHCLS